jgi:hypothetical protein
MRSGALQRQHFCGPFQQGSEFFFGGVLGVCGLGFGDDAQAVWANLFYGASQGCPRGGSSVLEQPQLIRPVVERLPLGMELFAARSVR